MDDMAETKDTGRPNASETTKVIVRACDMCRKKKIRCEPTADGGCLQCIVSQKDCHFTPLSSARRPRRPAGYKAVVELQKKIKRMEDLLQTALKDNESLKDGSSQNQNSAFGEMSLDLNGANDGQERHQTAVMTIPDSQSLESAPGTHAPAAFMALSTQFERNSTIADQNSTILHELSDNSSPESQTWKTCYASDASPQLTFQELPTKSFALVLIKDTFKSFNSTFPFFNQQELLDHFENHYSECSPSDPGWYASINVIFSLAHRFRAMRTSDPRPDNHFACGYMQNALGVVSELLMLYESLPAIQALLGMTIILQGTPDPRSCSVLIAAAMRLIQAMGLHRQNQDPSLTEAEIELRRSIFWTAFYLDKDISIRTGQPPAQDDDDMDVELPSGAISELLLGGDSQGYINFFNFRIGLAIIQGQIYKNLCSVQASQQSQAQREAVAHDLNDMLEFWRSSVPVDFEEQTAAFFQESFGGQLGHMIILRITYNNCLIAVHRHLPPVSNPPMDLAFGCQNAASPSESICIIESRKAIRLLQITPHGNYACVWLLLPYLFAAITVLLDNVILNPTYPAARSDLDLAWPFLHLLEFLAAEGKSKEVQRMYGLCVDVYAKATEAVDKVDIRMIGVHLREGGAVVGKKGAGNESVEEFLKRIECVSGGCFES